MGYENRALSLAEHTLRKISPNSKSALISFHEGIGLPRVQRPIPPQHAQARFECR